MALKEKVAGMYDLLSEVVESTDLLYAALVNNNLKVLDRADELLSHAAGRSSELTEEITRDRLKEPLSTPYLSVPAHIEVMAKNMGRVSAGLRKKIKEDILFSDRALGELDYMFERVRDIAVNARDMVLARNTLVARHLAEADRALVMSANDYATQHEERLIEGTCLPKASALYLEMLDAFKDTASHAKNIGRDLAG
jgi:Na+/phosphate symporter